MTKSFNWPVIGHNNIIRFFERAIASNRLVHAYLFVGPNGIGKETVASYFIQSLLCTSQETGLPCGECDHCRQFKNNIHPDVIKIGKLDKDKNVTIDEVRKIIAKLSLKSFIAKYKVAVINDADYLSEEAANALLKTLEEPSGQTIIILLATSPSQLPATIVSRCQLIRFLPVNKKILVSYLEKNSKIDRTTKESMVRLSYGLPGVLIQWLKNKQNWEEYINNINNKIRVIESPLYENINACKNIFSSSLLFNQKIQVLQKELDEWINILRDLLLLKNGNIREVKHYFIINDLERISYRMSMAKIRDILNWLVKMKNIIRYNPNPELTMENFYIYMNN